MLIELLITPSPCRTQSEAIYVKQESGFTDLGSTLRALISAVAAGETRLTDLVNKQSQGINEHITHCSSELSELVISQGIQTRHELAIRDRETEHRNLVESLQYEGMNDRYGQITMSHRSTFHWIFGPGHQRVEADSPRESSDNHDDDDDDDGDDGDDDDGDGDDDDGDGVYDDDYQSFQDWAADELVVQKSSKSFLDWLHSRGPALLWVNGKVGSGKSTFMKFLVKDPRTQAGLGAVAILHHFVWSSGQPMERRAEGMYCSLLSQLLLLHPELSATVSAMIPPNQSRKLPRDWPIEELHESMHAALLASPEPVCIFLDGIDEMDQSQGLDDVLDRLEGYLSVPQLRICIASRPEPIITHRLSKYPALRLQDLTRGDIRRYA
jgi:hypothetical protein